MRGEGGGLGRGHCEGGGGKGGGLGGRHCGGGLDGAVVSELGGGEYLESLILYPE